MGALVGIARHDGIDELVFEIVPDNTATLAKLSAIGAVTTLVDGLMEGRLVTGEIPKDRLEDGFVDVLEKFRS
jgi:hypothetical protein